VPSLSIDRSSPVTTGCRQNALRAGDTERGRGCWPWPPSAA